MFHVEHHSISNHTVSRETFLKTKECFGENSSSLNTFIDQLLWWNERVNLVSRNVPRETIRNHVLHSLLLSQIDIFKNAKFIVDAGTGGGLPGLPLAITHTGKRFLLNDIVSKKCLAVKQIVRHLGLKNTQIADASIEGIEIDVPFLLISKHAFKINELYQLTTHLPWTSIVFYKGSSFEQELSGIEEALNIESYDLSAGSSFYTGKALVIIRR